MTVCLLSVAQLRILAFFPQFVHKLLVRNDNEGTGVQIQSEYFSNTRQIRGKRLSGEMIAACDRGCGYKGANG